jgi:predicted metal-dependent hydrolase
MADITVRKVKFEFPDELDDVLPGVDLDSETYLVAFSLTMPYLEPYLIRTFRSVADDITDPQLAADVRDFIGQEAQHFQNHRRVNEMIKGQLGPDVAAALTAEEDRLDADYRRYSATRSRRFNLVYAEGFEAMTCAMAMTFFDQAAVGRGPGAGRFGPWQQLWAWHAAEEIEHRTVAFGVYEHLEGNWAYRVSGSLRAQAHFQRTIDRMQRILLASQGAPTRIPKVPTWLADGRRRYLTTFTPSYDPGAIEAPPLVDLILAPYTPT